MNTLTDKEWIQLIRGVFSPRASDHRLAIFVDVPSIADQDTVAWKSRRALAFQWAKQLNHLKPDLNLEEISLFVYASVPNNNADLPAEVYTGEGNPDTLTSDMLPHQGVRYEMNEILFDHQMIMAPTQFSATAPLKVLAKEFGFRAATMPGFSESMIPALKLDYDIINQRVSRIKELLDPAEGLDISFAVGSQVYTIHFDLRFREAHASGGRFPNPGTAGNLPSGESYIVPYEGEKGEPSLSDGTLPVQFGSEVVLYRIKANKAVDILSQGQESDRERKAIWIEPAYANIAEIGFGILGDFGVKPSGEILLDEKLGLHIAFGRSDHFGGSVGPKDFSAPDKVIHLDRIYIPETMNRIQVKEVEIKCADKPSIQIMKDEKYLIF